MGVCRLMASRLWLLIQVRIGAYRTCPTLRERNARMQNANAEVRFDAFERPTFFSLFCKCTRKSPIGAYWCVLGAYYVRI